MGKIDPGDSKWDEGGGGEKTPKCHVGPKLVAAVGYERYKAKTGTSMLAVRFLCLIDDNPDTSDVASIAFDDFALTDNAMWRLVDYARAVGYTDPFDPAEDDDIGALLTHGYCTAHLAEDTYNGKTKVVPKGDGDRKAFTAPGDYTEDPEWTTIIEAAEDNHKEYLAWRAKNPRKSGGGYAGGSGSGGGGGSPPQDDDIPFIECCDGDPEWVQRLERGVV